MDRAIAVFLLVHLLYDQEVQFLLPSARTLFLLQLFNIPCIGTDKISSFLYLHKHLTTHFVVLLVFFSEGTQGEFLRLSLSALEHSELPYDASYL